MAAQATAAQHIVDQLQWGGYAGGDGDIVGGGQTILRSEMGANLVDFIALGEVERTGSRPYLTGMTWAAGCSHVGWMGRFSDQAGMGFFDLTFIVMATMAGGARQVVGQVQLDPAMTSGAADWFWVGDCSLNRERAR